MPLMMVPLAQQPPGGMGPRSKGYCQPTWLNECTPPSDSVVMVIVFSVVSCCHHMMGFWE